MIRFSAILLLASATYAVGGELPTGQYGSGHDALHTPFYFNLFNNKKNVSCCHDQDCRPTQERLINDHYEVMINGVWVKVPVDTIIPKSAPDGQAHVCAGQPTFNAPHGSIYCVILEPET